MAGNENADGSAAVELLIQGGSDLASALVGASVGLVGGPPGALGGAVLGVAVKHAAVAILERLRGRQAIRAGAALAVLQQDAQNALKRAKNRATTSSSILRASFDLMVKRCSRRCFWRLRTARGAQTPVLSSSL